MSVEPQNPLLQKALDASLARNEKLIGSLEEKGHKIAKLEKSVREMAKDNAHLGHELDRVKAFLVFE